MIEPTGDGTDYAVGLLLRLAQRRAARIFSEALHPLGLEPPHFGVLHTLGRLGPQSQRRLFDLLGMDKSTMVRVIDDLEDKGMVVRGPSEGDRRAYAVDLTPHGRDILAQATKTGQVHVEILLAGLTSDERATLRDLLRRISTD